MTKVLGAAWLIVSIALFAFGASAEASCDATDLNGDNVTNEADFEILKAYFGSDDGVEGYDPAADLNDDGTVDFGDLSILQACL